MFLSLQNGRVGLFFETYHSPLKSSKVAVIRDPLITYQPIISESLSICIRIGVIDIV